jgi:hypothetical protein
MKHIYEYQVNHKHIDDSCGVCLENFGSSEIIYTPSVCTHTLHIKCHIELLRHKINICPLCRTEYKNKIQIKKKRLRKNYFVSSNK